VKHEYPAAKPDCFQEEWPGHYRIFHWFEFACGIPHALFMITTLKENGVPNACYQSWSSFGGDGAGYYAVMPSVLKHSHTYRNIMDRKEFCVNFLKPSLHDACLATIEHNEEETDEIAAGGFTAEKCSVIEVPRIKESFLSLECVLSLEQDLSGAGTTSLIVGRVEAIAIDEQFAADLDSRCGENAFTFFVHHPMNPANAEGTASAIATVEILSRIEPES
jgi:flavin reductase (DIM6/NTAB) family NADH-FMN oxidoreductase RutF